MSTNPKVDYNALAAFGLLAIEAAKEVAVGNPDELLTPMPTCPTLPGEVLVLPEVRRIAAIAVLRYLVENYDSAR